MNNTQLIFIWFYPHWHFLLVDLFLGGTYDQTTSFLKHSLHGFVTTIYEEVILLFDQVIDEVILLFWLSLMRLVGSPPLVAMIYYKKTKRKQSLSSVF